MNASEEAQDQPQPGAKTRKISRRRALLAAVLALVGLFVLTVSVVFAASPAAIRQPKMEHYHFRMQVVANGQLVDFGKQPFQTAYEKGQCSGELSAQPIHFHDGKNQFVHVHWQKMTGGLVLKNYGWNYVGGMNSVLGYRLDNLPKVKKVPIHGTVLPRPAEGARFWVYTGDENGYKQRAFDDFTGQNLEDFFGRESNFMKSGAAGGVLAWLFPKAAAHEGPAHDETTVESEAERLTRINNLLGSVVIFAQKEQPSDAQIKARFANLEPLSDSTCGG